MKKIGLYPGSFDPITNGHMDIVERALKIFDEVIIAVVKNTAKKTLFSQDERKQLVDEIYKNNENVKCISLDSKLTVTLANEVNASAIIRGLRAMSDFEYEFQIASINRSQNKEIALYKGKLSKFVHVAVESALKKKISSFDK